MPYSTSRVSLILAISWSLLSCSAEISRKELRNKEDHEVVTQLKTHTYSKHNRVDPSRVSQLSWQPRVFLYRGFLTNEECDHLISLNTESQLPTNLEHSLDTQDDITASIEKRISAWTFLPKEYSKPLNIVHFGSEKTKQKYVNFSNKAVEAESEQPLATIILFLSNVSQGGGIIFPKAKVSTSCNKISTSLMPKKGNAILIITSKVDASPDKSSFYARCPVLEKESWIAEKIFSIKREKVTYWMNENESDCSDEDESCPQWAVTGECQRNPVFMIGTPDYYGACRKSCNVC